MKKSRYSEEQIIGFLKQADAGMPIQEPCRTGGFSYATFRDECLNEQWFATLPQARHAIAVWRQDYNEVRPHSSCRRMPPAKFATLHRQRAIDAVLPTTEGFL